MDAFLLTKLSIPHINNAVLSALIAIYLLRSKPSTPEKRYLGIFFTFFAFYFIELLITHSVMGTWADIAQRLTTITLTASLMAMLLFAYRFAGETHPLEERIALSVMAFVILLSTAEAVTGFTRGAALRELSVLNNPFIVLVFMLWIIRTLLRKAAGEVAQAETIADPTSGGVSVLQRMGTFFQRIYRTPERKIHSLRVFALLVLLLTPIPFFPLMERFALVYNAAYIYIINLSALIFLMGFIIYYLDRGMGRSSLAIKSIGFNIVLMMIVFSAIGFLTIQAFERSYDEHRRLELQIVADAIDEDNVFSNLQNVVYIAAAPLRKDRSNTAMRLMYRKPVDSKIDGYSPAFLERYVKPVFIPEVLSRVEDSTPEGFREAKLAVIRNAAPQTTRPFVKDNNLYAFKDILRHSVYFNVNGNMQICAMFSYLAFRRYIHQYALYFIVIILIGVLLILAAFSWFFQRRFIAPLSELIGGVDRVNAGQYNVKVPVRVENEIGYLTHSFNDMIASVNKAGEQLRDYANDLENKVNERTRNLAQVNAELEQKNERLNQTLKELRIAQNKLLLQEKMAALGNLIAGVAHEINTPIGVIGSFLNTSGHGLKKIEALIATVDESSAIHNNPQMEKTLRILRENSLTAREAAERIAAIVKSLKNFAQLDEAEFQIADIHEGLDSTLNLLRHELHGRITVHKQYGDIPKIHCSPQHLNQVFMNLIHNAANAIDGPGSITIETRLDNNRLIIRISDSGKGIPRERLENIFEPGFDRDDNRIKMGSGLPTSYSIIESHQGSIDLQSEPGKGTTVTISLPLAAIRERSEA